MSYGEGLLVLIGAGSIFFVRAPLGRRVRGWFKQDDPAWLYFIGAATGPIKVGITRTSPEERCRQLQTGHPARLKVYEAILVTDPHQAEGSAHNALAEYQHVGEWYEREYALSFAEAVKREMNQAPLPL